jgi:hypothetical protein
MRVSETFRLWSCVFLRACLRALGLSLGEARPSARRATARRTHRPRWLSPRRYLWREERLPASESRRALSASGDALAGAFRLRRDGPT